MDSDNEFYLHKLQSTLELRRSKNKSYSLRAFARDLGIHPASLSAVFNKKRRLPITLCLQLCDKLQLDLKERQAFLSSAQSELLTGISWALPKDLAITSTSTKQTLKDDALHFKLLAEWEYYALLTFVDTSTFDGQIESIAQSFGWTLTKSTDLVQHLRQLGLLKIENGKLLRQQTQQLATTEDITSQALQLAHLGELDLAKARLTSTPVNLRDYSSNCMAINRHKLPQAKRLIREFRRKMETLLETGSRKDVYLLGIQLFPLTQRETSTRQRLKSAPSNSIDSISTKSNSMIPKSLKQNSIKADSTQQNFNRPNHTRPTTTKRSQ
jgi:uncharacterized protein (TIGR02147 family)